jgi:hypothetical protein
MKAKFTPSSLSHSDEEQLRQALKRLRVSARRIEVALDEGSPLPPPWARAAIIKASLAVLQIARMICADKGKKPKSEARKK